MKFVLLVAVWLACGHASRSSDMGGKYTPSFPDGRIIQGHNATPHSAPYIVSISRADKYKHHCGGTIIAKDWILTAAHCFQPDDKIMIVAGLHVLTNIDSRVQIRQINFIKNHEKYAGGPTPSDIALLHLSEPLEYNRYVQPASLPAIGEVHTGKTHLYGWGMYEPYTVANANVLQTVETNLVEFNECKQVFPIDKTHLCSDSLGKQIAACTGDSGGPLVIQREGASSEVIGIVSYGESPCGVNNLPSVHVRVSAFIDWIVKVQHAYYTLYFRN